MKKMAERTILLIALMFFAGSVLATTATTSQTPSAAKTATASPAPAASHAKATRANQNTPMALATPENLTGTIESVNSGVLTVIGENGVPYDFLVNRGTHIVMQNMPGQKLTPSGLAQDVHDQASIHFVPMSDGNLAKTIEIRAS
jgi:hypothetical protein